MLSFKSDPALKALHVKQAEQHAAADMLLSGTYGKHEGNVFRACSIGCFAHDIDPSNHDNLHSVIAEHRGLPEWLIRLQDSIFENLPAAARVNFHVELARRIPVGANLDPVQHWIAIARIDRMLTSLRTMLKPRHKYGVHEAIEQTIAVLEIGRYLHESASVRNSCNIKSAWSALASVAWSTAESAAKSAESAESAASAASTTTKSTESAAWLAESAASTATESAESMAWSAARAETWSATESARSAAESAQSAARSAARAATWSAARAATWSATWSEIWSAARSVAWEQERDALFAALDRAS